MIGSTAIKCKKAISVNMFAALDLHKTSIQADLLRVNMIKECYFSNMEVREVRDLSRERHYFFAELTSSKTRSMPI